MRNYNHIYTILILVIVSTNILFPQVMKIPYNGSQVEIIVSGSIYYQDSSPATNDPIAGVLIWFTSNEQDGSANEARILSGTTYYKTNPDTLVFASNIATDTLYICALDLIKNDNISSQGEYLVKVNGVDYTVTTSNIIFLFGNNGTTAMNENIYELPHNILLKQNFPNPFNPSTKIEYIISNPENVKINIYDINGRLVKNLLNEFRNTGGYSVTWNGRDDAGNLVATGNYFYQIISGDFVQSKKMIFVK